jgi:cobaltochelatase CobS
MIEAGHWVTPIDSIARRPRWKHEDCDHVPTATVVVGAPGEDGEARKQVADLTVRVSKLQNRLREIEQKTPRSIVVSVAGREPVTLDERTNVCFAEVIELVAAGEHLFLPGPAGCGKTHLAEQVARALGLTFSTISCSAGMSEAQLLGRMVPRGAGGAFEFVTTPFLEAYEKGGLFLFDEIDAADPNVLLVINSALANGHLSVPSRPEAPVATRHPDFRCMAAANTFGRGADRQYVGRSQLDESTLDRFRLGTVPMDYDRDLELALWQAHAGAAHDKLLTRLWAYRDAILANRLERCLSTRFLIGAARAITRGRDLGYIESKLFAGWRADEVRKAKGE